MNRFRGRPRGARSARGDVGSASGGGASALWLAALASLLLAPPAAAAPDSTRAPSPADVQPVEMMPSEPRVELSPDSLRILATLDSLATVAGDRYVGIPGPLGGTLFKVGRLYRAELVRRGRNFHLGLYDFRLQRVNAGPDVTLLLVLPNNKLLTWYMVRPGAKARGHYVWTMDDGDAALLDRFRTANGLLHAEIGIRTENARFTWRGEAVAIPAGPGAAPATR